MGQAIEGIASSMGHEVTARLSTTPTAADLKGADVAIEFSNPKAAVVNLKACFKAGVPVVSGTTGWLDKWEEIREACTAQKGGLFYASNFSIGVNLFFEAAKNTTQSLDVSGNYDISIIEEHHVHKLDAPSGTAITLAEHVLAASSTKTHWKLTDTPAADTLALEAIREDEIPGTHHLIFTSPEDTITITHRAHGREGFARGAVRAALYMQDRKGVYSMNDLLNARR